MDNDVQFLLNIGKKCKIRNHEMKFLVELEFIFKDQMKAENTNILYLW